MLFENKSGFKIERTIIPAPAGTFAVWEFTGKKEEGKESKKSWGIEPVWAFTSELCLFKDMPEDKETTSYLKPISGYDFKENNGGLDDSCSHQIIYVGSLAMCKKIKNQLISGKDVGLVLDFPD